MKTKFKICGECADGEKYNVEAVFQITGVAYIDGGRLIPYRRNICADHLECVLNDKLRPGAKVIRIIKAEGQNNGKKN